MCVASNNADLMELLCRRGANMSLVDNVGATALHYAAQLDSPSAPATSADMATLRTVLGTGLDPDLRDEDGRTPLMWAATSGN